MFTHILDVFNSLKATGVAAFFVAVIPVVYKFINPYLQKKIATEKNVHAQQALELGLKLANVIVPELAVLAALSKSDRKKEAMRFVNDQLKNNGFDLDYQVIAGLVEKAYQAYKATGADNHFAPVTPAPTESVTNTQSSNLANTAAEDVSQTPKVAENPADNVQKNSATDQGSTGVTPVQPAEKSGANA